MAEDDLYYTGGTIIMDHGHGISTIYSHLETVMVSVGDKINQGDIIGTVGSTGLIVLPQALKIVIPGIVNTFIAMTKDTSLVMIIGLFDILMITKSSITDAKWLGLEWEGYAFVGLLFWVLCFGMSRYSQWLERRLDTGRRD